MDTDLKFIEAVINLAAIPTSEETPGVAPDPALDNLIFAARLIRDREGYGFK